MAVASFFIGQFAAGFFAGIIPGLLGLTAAQSTDWFNSVEGQFLFVLLAEAFTIGVIVFFLRNRRASFKTLGFYRRPLWKDLGYVGVGFVVYFLMLVMATSLSQSLLGVNVDEKQELGFDNAASSIQLLLTFVSLVVLPPIAEEIVFRGMLFGGLRTKLSFGWATAITSVLFAIPHLLTGGAGVLLWIAAIDTLVLSLVLCYVREKTGNLWACMGIHALKNSVAFLYLFVFARALF